MHDKYFGHPRTEEKKGRKKGMLLMQKVSSSPQKDANIVQSS
jgi:hypothetical protein